MPGDVRPTLRHVIVATGLAGPPWSSPTSSTRWAYLNYIRLLDFPGHCCAPPEVISTLPALRFGFLLADFVPAQSLRWGK